MNDASFTDLFCGAGGSTKGGEEAGGRAVLALNHWAMAIETHATNYPHAQHDCADVSALTTAQIRRYPDSDILLASPECTNHSLAKGARRRKPQAASLFDDGPAGDEEQDRSRATMWDVVRFAEQKIIKGRPYRAIVVENVVDAYRWGYEDDGGLFAAWLQAMEALGYEREIVWLNSMFCPPTPQSRDRMYVVFWQRGIRKPNLKVEPPAWCPSCSKIVLGRQAFKRADRPAWGRYGAQYLFRCPDCNSVTYPGAYPAATAIDWELPADRIGDRVRPLASATRERIRRGLERLSREPFVIRLMHGGNPRPLTLPIVTLTKRHDLGVVLPVAGNTYESTPGNRARRTDTQPADTVHGTLDRALVVPPMGGVELRDAETDPGPTQTTTTRAAVVLSNRAHNVPRLADLEPTHPALTGEHLGVVHLRQHQSVTPVEEPTGTVSAGGGHHGVVVRNNTPRGDPGQMSTPTHEPIRTLTARCHQSLVIPYDRTGHPTGAEELAAPTLTTKDRVALVVPSGGTWRREASDAAEPHPTMTGTEASGLAWTDDEIDDCRFRMFALHEIADTMVMRNHGNGDEYVVVGNKRERMAQYGNAVTPPAMRFLMERLLEVL